MAQQELSGRRVAFFGGSFDPPHLGHLAIARAAQASLALDTVLFAPVGSQPLKPAGSTASFEDRMAMTELAIEGEPGFEISAIDAPKEDGSPNYTFDTLSSLRSQSGIDGALFFLMGADSFLNLKNWHRAAEIPFLAPLIVAFRPGESLDDLKAVLPEGLMVEAVAEDKGVSRPALSSGIEVKNLILRNKSGQTVPFYLLPGLHEDISASQIRETVCELGYAEGSAGSQWLARTRELLPARVIDYIRDHGLYS